MKAKADLTVETFLLLRQAFFDPKGKPLAFSLRDKRNTQDDPLDGYIGELLRKGLSRGTTCIQSPGPLTTPDLVVLRPEACEQASSSKLRTNLSSIVAVEVKKLERTKSGAIARPSGLDYNTTPPCGTVRVYDAADHALDIRCFYLYLCQEPESGSTGRYRLTALALCDGNMINEDFKYYLTIVGERTKQIGLGTYRDGLDRQRPMLVFANPLGASELDHQVTLIHSEKDIQVLSKELALTNIVQRSVSKGRSKEFFCYRYTKDVQKEEKITTLRDPFPMPEREEKTQPRGKFRLNFTVKRT